MKPSPIKKIIAGVLGTLLAIDVGLTPLAEANQTDTVWTHRQSALEKSTTPSQLAFLSAADMPAAEHPSQLKISSLAPTSALAQTLPLQYGNVRDAYTAPSHSSSQPLREMILVQDVHLNLEAQKNIVGLLEKTLTNENTQRVYLEGACGVLDLTSLRRFSRHDVTRRVADAFLEDNRISGPSYVSVVTPSNVSFVGADDKTHYDANVDAVRQAAPIKQSRLQRHDEDGRVLRERRDTVFNPTLKSFHILAMREDDGEIGLGAFASALLSEAERAQVPVSSDGDLRRFVSAYQLEAKLDFKRVEVERQQVLRQLAERAAPSDMKLLAARAAAFQSGGVRYGEFYTALKDLLTRNGVSLRSTPAFAAYIQYVLLSDNLNGEHLLRDVQSTIAVVMNRLCKTSAERQLVSDFRRWSLEGKLLTFRLTPTEWNEYKTAAQPTIMNDPFSSFYNEAEKRSAAIVQNIFADAAAHHVTRGVLVAGGFHTPAIAELLKKSGVSYVVVAPNITKVDDSGSNYLSIFTREKTPLEQLFQSEKLSVMPAEEILGTPAAASNQIAFNLYEQGDHARGQGTRFQAGDVVVDEPSNLNSSRILDRLPKLNLAIGHTAGFALGSNEFLLLSALVLLKNFPTFTLAAFGIGFAVYSALSWKSSMRRTGLMIGMAALSLHASVGSVFGAMGSAHNSFVLQSGPQNLFAWAILGLALVGVVYRFVIDRKTPDVRTRRWWLSAVLIAILIGNTDRIESSRLPDVLPVYPSAPQRPQNGRTAAVVTNGNGRNIDDIAFEAVTTPAKTQTSEVASAPLADYVDVPLQDARISVELNDRDELVVTGVERKFQALKPAQDPKTRTWTSFWLTHISNSYRGQLKGVRLTVANQLQIQAGDLKWGAISPKKPITLFLERRYNATSGEEEWIVAANSDFGVATTIAQRLARARVLSAVGQLKADYDSVLTDPSRFAARLNAGFTANPNRSISETREVDVALERLLAMDPLFTEQMNQQRNFQTARYFFLKEVGFVFARDSNPAFANEMVDAAAFDAFLEQKMPERSKSLAAYQVYDAVTALADTPGFESQISSSWFQQQLRYQFLMGMGATSKAATNHSNAAEFSTVLSDLKRLDPNWITTDEMRRLRDTFENVRRFDRETDPAVLSSIGQFLSQLSELVQKNVENKNEQPKHLINTNTGNDNLLGEDGNEEPVANRLVVPVAPSSDAQQARVVFLKTVGAASSMVKAVDIGGAFAMIAAHANTPRLLDEAQLNQYEQALDQLFASDSSLHPIINQAERQLARARYAVVSHATRVDVLTFLGVSEYLAQRQAWDLRGFARTLDKGASALSMQRQKELLPLLNHVKKLAGRDEWSEIATASSYIKELRPKPSPSASPVLTSPTQAQWAARQKAGSKEVLRKRSSARVFFMAGLGTAFALAIILSGQLTDADSAKWALVLGVLLDSILLVWNTRGALMNFGAKLFSLSKVPAAALANMRAVSLGLNQPSTMRAPVRSALAGSRGGVVDLRVWASLASVGVLVITGSVLASLVLPVAVISGVIVQKIRFHRSVKKLLSAEQDVRSGSRSYVASMAPKALLENRAMRFGLLVWLQLFTSALAHADADRPSVNTIVRIPYIKTATDVDALRGNLGYFQEAGSKVEPVIYSIAADADPAIKAAAIAQIDAARERFPVAYVVEDESDFTRGADGTYDLRTLFDLAHKYNKAVDVFATLATRGQAVPANVRVDIVSAEALPYMSDDALAKSVWFVLLGGSVSVVPMEQVLAIARAAAKMA